MRRSWSDPVRGLTPTAVAFLLTALVFAGDAHALSCPEIPPDQRIAGADVAFVGRIVSERPVGGEERVYRFAVEQVVKGPLGAEVEIHAVRLTDLDDRPIAVDAPVGVLASSGEGGNLVTGSCSLVEPGSLLAATDEPRGMWIKIAIGIVILGAVLAYSWRRLRQRRADLERGRPGGSPSRGS
jgi:hypothetical protein